MRSQLIMNSVLKQKRRRFIPILAFLLVSLVSVCITVISIALSLNLHSQALHYSLLHSDATLTMAAAHVTSSNPNHPKSNSLAFNKSVRTPLLPSDSDNAPPLRPKACKIVSSRYLSSGSSSSGSSSATGASSMKRCPSPSPAVSRAAPVATATPMVKRCQSAKRIRPSTLRPGTAIARVSTDQRTLASARSLSVSFQGESYSMPVDKVKAAAAEKPTPAVTVRPTSGSGGRKGTPERRRNAAMATLRASADNLKAVMQQKRRWPGTSAMSKSVDFGKTRSLSHRSVVTDLGNSMMAIDIRGSCDDRNSKLDTGLKSEGNCNNNGNLGIGLNKMSSIHCVESDSESASSGSISSVTESNGHVPCALNGIGGALHGIRGIKVQAKQPNNRLAQTHSPMTAVSKHSSMPKLMSAKRSGSDSPLSSPKAYASSRGQASPSRGAVRLASPTKLASLPLPFPMRGLSPSMARGVSDDSVISTPSMLSFVVEARKVKMGESRIVDAHALRMLHNRFLQWRFVNGRADYASFVMAMNAERSLYNSWVKISKMRESVKAKALELQMLRHILKLSAVLDGQMIHLEKWASMDGGYSSSLSGATEALHASSLRLPVIGRARVSVQKLKDAIYSALEMLQAMSTSIFISSSKVGGVHHLVTELADVTLQERDLLVQCRDLLSSNAAMQINECSLRAHTSQLSEVSSIG